MWIAEHWKEYEVLDASDGEKLERWGPYLLVRPDPQVIWHTPRRHTGWRRHNARYRRSSKGGGTWTFFDLPKQWEISYDLQHGTVRDADKADRPAGASSDCPAGKLQFRLQPFAFKHTGVFPEQAANWDWFSGLIRGAGRPIRVLNLFAYTGGATLAAAAAGASVTHVDASKGMVRWASENAALSGLGDCSIRWIVDDCRKFVEREIRRGSRYDAIIMDPPSYGRGPKGELWKLEDSIDSFLRLTAQLLTDRPLFFLVNSYTTGLAPAVLTYLITTALGERSGHVEAQELGLPVRSTGLILPCGAAGRCSWTDAESA